MTPTLVLVNKTMSNVCLLQRFPRKSKAQYQPPTVRGKTSPRDQLPIHSSDIPSDPPRHRHHLPSRISATADNARETSSALWPFFCGIDGRPTLVSVLSFVSQRLPLVWQSGSGGLHGRSSDTGLSGRSLKHPYPISTMLLRLNHRKRNYMDLTLLAF